MKKFVPKIVGSNLIRGRYCLLLSLSLIRLVLFGSNLSFDQYFPSTRRCIVVETVLELD